MTATLDSVVNNKFDYIIIGGGTAGLCLAARLSEDPSVTVLCLEAGEENLNDPAILLPGQHGSHFGQKPYDWCFKTTPQKHSNNREVPWSRGKGLGGSSSINFLCWSIPPAEEINDWERLGNPGWNWETYKKYLSKIAKLELGDSAANAYENNPEAPISVARPAKISELDIKAQQTLAGMGFPLAPDPLGGNPKGMFFAPSTIDPKTHTRSYATTAYYLPNTRRSNFHILVSANVNKIIVGLETLSQELVATGVEFTYKGQVHIAHVEKEVIVCAGALKSPQILELSGIGRKDILEALGIPVKLDLPGVGENIQEHLFISYSFELPESTTVETFDILRDPEQAKKHSDLFAIQEGIHTMGLTALYFNSLDSFSDRASAIYQATKEKILENASTYPPGLLDQYKIQLGRLDAGAPGCELMIIPAFMSLPNPPAPGKKYLTLAAGVNHSFSRGTIHSTSKDPSVDPAFDPHCFEEDIDLQTFIGMVKFIRKLPEHAPLNELMCSPVKEINPGPEVVTDSQITEHVKDSVGTIFHTVGSLSMLPRDKGGVVDPSLKVYGTANIRVADLSIVPLHFAAHTQATAYVIAERVADIIKGHL